MSSTRTHARKLILGDIRSALKADGDDRARQFIVQKKLRGHARNLIPSRAMLPIDARQRLFQTMLETQLASVAHINNAEQIGDAVGSYLRSLNLEKVICTGSDKIFDAVDWEAAHIARKVGRATGDDPISLSHADVAAAETGTLFLLSSAANPTSLNFLPEHHIVVVRAVNISGSYEDAWEQIRKITGSDRQGGVQIPRTVNLISGPSRTGDIEQTIIMGAHGPRRLHVIVIDE